MIIAVHARSGSGKIFRIVDTLIDPGTYNITFLLQPVHEMLLFALHDIAALEQRETECGKKKWQHYQKQRVEAQLSAKTIKAEHSSQPHRGLPSQNSLRPGRPARCVGGFPSLLRNTVTRKPAPRQYA
ncbi:hypothetical protein [Solidesulfovibrio sp. C21]|uniref:hypothetical protein n=1 Tax=Solidesulfovibrio sp. C21 TaxID=3398613 RepID=UPI0039FD1BC4